MSRSLALLTLVLAFAGCNSLLDNRPASLGQDFGEALPEDSEPAGSVAARDVDASAPVSAEGADDAGQGVHPVDAGDDEEDENEKVECKQGHGDCNGDPTDGCETNLQTAKHHCGKCGVICVSSCRNGECRIGK